jgi:16S rRNA (uracil1498-N3)-methyltransferase
VNLFYQPLLPQGVHYLDPEESRHCVKVLRRKNGDAIRITDGAGSFYDAVISEANPARCKFSITGSTRVPPRDYIIHIAIAPTRNPDRIEWFVEKATEFGIDKISLISTDHCEKIFVKRDRLIRMAVSAMKQSLKATLPEITEVISFSDCVGGAREIQKFIAFVDESNPVHLQYAAQARKTTIVLIGPEGDFSADELSVALSAGFIKVSLGESRLRTETAGIAACHILNLINS